ncbi:MAG: helix-turn-helix domain-containing protein [Candidatus Paceibacterota bacterium]
MANYKSAWMSIEDAAKVLNCSPKDIEMLINVTMVADIRNSGEKLVNIEIIKDFFKKVHEIAKRLLPSPKIEPETKKPKKGNKEGDFVGGKEAAENLNITYDVFIRQCKEGIIPAEIKGRGWRIERNKLEKLIKSKKESIVPNNDPPPDLSPDHGGVIKTGKPEVDKRDTSSIVLPEDSSDDEDIQPPENYRPEVLPKPGMRSYTVKARKTNRGDYCRINEVAKGLNIPEAQIKKWITAKQIKAVEEIEQAKSIWYIEKESLRTFLEKYSIMVTFDTTH